MIRIAALLSLAWTFSMTAATTTGSVFSVTGEPVPGAKVAVYRAEETEPQRVRLAARAARTPLGTATTDVQGRFSVQTKESGLLHLIVTRDGYAPKLERVLAGDNVVLDLHRAEALQGRVTANGKPVGGALVAVFSGDTEMWQTHTDARGQYAVPNPDGWGSSLLVLHPDYAPQRKSRADSEKGDLPLQVVLTSGQRVSGKVLTATGAPAANAQLLAGDWLAGTADEQGRFALPHVAADATTIQAMAGGATGRAQRAGERDLIIRLGEPRSVSGSIRDASKQPLAGAKVIAVNVDAMSDASMDVPSINVITDEKGLYRVEALDAGNVQILVDGGDALQFAHAFVDLGTTRTGRADITATAKAYLRGVVVDEHGRPVAGARVHLAQAGLGPLYAFDAPDFTIPTTTGHDGRFRIAWYWAEGWPTYEVQVLHRRYAIAVSEQLGRGAESKELKLVLREGVELTGIVTDAAGKPIAGAAVVAIERSGMRLDEALVPTGGEPIAETGADGKFTIRVNQKPHQLNVWKESFARVHVDDVTPGKDPVRIVLPAK